MGSRRQAMLAFVALACLPRPVQAQQPQHARLTERVYRDACDSGDASACVVFGLMSETGRYVEQDLARARALYRRGCEQGELVGCTNLGLMYEEGRGGPQDLEEARGRYRIACEGSEQLACDLLQAFERQDAGGAHLSLKKGRVADAETTTALSNALVEVPELDIHRVSDAQGNLTLGLLPEGTYRVTAKRLGYLDLDAELQVPGGSQFMVMMNRVPEPDTAVYGRVVGQVTDGGSESIADVDVTIVGQDGVRAITNQQGRFALANLEPGVVQVRFTRIGYAPRTATLVVHPGRTTELLTAMSPQAIELDPIEVTVRSQFLERSGYYQRARQGLGQYFDRRAIERLNPLEVSDVVQRMTRVRVMDTQIPGRGVVAVAPGLNTPASGPCVLQVFVDGVQSSDPDINQIPPEWLEAMEVYVGASVPIQYSGVSGLSPCGAVLLWTRR
jgi:hypothetical protein